MYNITQSSPRSPLSTSTPVPSPQPLYLHLTPPPVTFCTPNSPPTPCTLHPSLHVPPLSPSLPHLHPSLPSHSSPLLPPLLPFHTHTTLTVPFPQAVVQTSHKPHLYIWGTNMLMYMYICVISNNVL